MSKYTIQKIEIKVSKNGNKYAKLALSDENDLAYPDVAMFRGFSSLKTGDSIEGTLEAKEWNGKKSYTLVAGNMGDKPAWAQKKQDVVTKSVEKAQDRKEKDIMVSSTMRDAVQIALAELGTGKDATEYSQRILHWRKWGVENWDSLDGVDKTGGIPF